MAAKNSAEGTAPTDFKPDESVLRHGQVHRTAGHRAVEPATEHSDSRGTQHRASVAAAGKVGTDTVFGRLRSQLTESSEG